MALSIRSRSIALPIIARSMSALTLSDTVDHSQSFSVVQQLLVSAPDRKSNEKDAHDRKSNEMDAPDRKSNEMDAFA